MASSTYRLLVSVGRGDTRFSDGKVQEEAESILNSENYQQTPDMDYIAESSDLFILKEAIQTRSRSKTTSLLLVDGGIHSCRETLLLKVFTIFNAIAYAPILDKLAVVHIWYLYEGGYSITENHMEAMLEFGRRFFGSAFGQTFMLTRVKGKGVILSVKLFQTGMYHRFLYEASFILWIFRRTEILQYALKLESVRSKEDLYLKLAEEFLRNDIWGDKANPVLNLSLFAYIMSNQDNGAGFLDRKEDLNGPCRAVLNTPVNILYYYYKCILLKIKDTSRGVIDFSGSSSESGLARAFNIFAELGKDTSKTEASSLRLQVADLTAKSTKLLQELAQARSETQKYKAIVEEPYKPVRRKGG